MADGLTFTCVRGVGGSSSKARSKSSGGTRTRSYLRKFVFMKIRLRTQTGWSDLVVNKDKERCDIDGARLWIGPGNQVYCNEVHTPDQVATKASAQSDRSQRTSA